MRYLRASAFRRPVCYHIAIVSIGVVLSSCGGSSGSGTAVSSPPPPSSVTISPATSSLTIGNGCSLKFSATVLPSNANQGVTWSMGGGAAAGSLSSSGLYTCPATLPNPSTLTVRATSVADETVSGTATITLNTGISSVVVSPSSTNLTLGANCSVQLSAVVNGDPQNRVTWNVVGGSTNGTVSSAGLYTCPTTLPKPSTVTVQATSVVDNSKSGTATVVLTGTASAATITAFSPAWISLGNPADELNVNVSVSGSGFTSTDTVTVTPGCPLVPSFVNSTQFDLIGILSGNCLSPGPFTFTDTGPSGLPSNAATLPFFPTNSQVALPPSSFDYAAIADLNNEIRVFDRTSGVLTASWATGISGFAVDGGKNGTGRILGLTNVTNNITWYDSGGNWEGGIAIPAPMSMIAAKDGFACGPEPSTHNVGVFVIANGGAQVMVQAPNGKTPGTTPVACAIGESASGNYLFVLDRDGSGAPVLYVYSLTQSGGAPVLGLMGSVTLSGFSTGEQVLALYPGIWQIDTFDSGPNQGTAVVLASVLNSDNSLGSKLALVNGNTLALGTVTASTGGNWVFPMADVATGNTIVSNWNPGGWNTQFQSINSAGTVSSPFSSTFSTSTAGAVIDTTTSKIVTGERSEIAFLAKN